MEARPQDRRLVDLRERDNNMSGWDYVLVVLAAIMIVSVVNACLKVGL